MKVRFSKSATHDVDRTAKSLEIDAGDRAANAFLEAIENRIAMLLDFPESGTLIGGPARDGIRSPASLI